MTTTTSLPIKDFKDLAATLRRFADVRETAKEPYDRVLVQVAKGRLKFIAGDENAAVVADAAPAEGKAKVVVKSRLLLSAADSLRGRGNVEVEVSGTTVLLRVENGGRVMLGAIAAQVPDFVRPVKKAEATDVVPHSGFGIASKVFPAVTSKHYPANLVYLRGGMGVLEMTGCDERSYARWGMYPQTTVEFGPLGALPAALFRSVADLTEPGIVAWGDGRLTIRSGRFLVGARLQPDRLPWPVPDSSDDVRVRVSKKDLLAALKGSMDSLHRSRLDADGLGTLVVAAWDSTGNVQLPADITGAGSVGVDADRMAKLLRALPGKQVDIEFGGGTARPIRLSSEEAEGWQTLLAPVM